MPIELISPPPAKQHCPCCGHQTLEAHEFEACPHCGHFTVVKAASDNSCRVCGWAAKGDKPVPVGQARMNYRLFGRCSEDEFYWEQPHPYPEEITTPRFVPPRIWLVNLTPDTYWDGIWEALQPFHDKSQQDWQLLIAQHPNPNRDKSSPTVWWNMYSPKETGFIVWRSSFEEMLAPLELPDTVVHNLCNALIEGLMPRNYILDTTKLKKYEPVADWSYWFLITDELHTIECRFGKTKAR